MGVVRLAAVPAAYVLMDREATIDRVAKLTAAAAKEGAQIIVFPEVFVPGTAALLIAEATRLRAPGLLVGMPR